MKTLRLSWKQGFFTIAAGQTVSLIGSSAVQFAIIWWIAAKTSSPMMLALTGFMAFLPQMLLGPFAGVWIDRMKRKYIVIAADLFIGIVSVLFAACFLFGTPPYWSACVVLGVRSIGNVFHTPAIQSVIPMLVPQDQLIRANGWSQFMQSGALMLGPVLGAAMYAALPVPIILLTDFIGAAVASAAMAVVSIPEIPAEAKQQQHFWREMKAGAAIFLKDKNLLILTAAACACMIFYMPLSSYYPLMTSSYFKETAWHASAVELMFAGGMMASALLFSLFGTARHRFFIIHAGLVGIGVSSAVCGILPATVSGFWIFALSCAVMGAGGNIYNIPYVAYMQESIPRQSQGRAFSLMGSLLSFAMPLGLLISGPVAEEYGVNRWFLITGIAVLFITVVSAICIRIVGKKQTIN